MLAGAAWVSLSFNPPNRVLGRRALNPLVYPRGTQARVYRPVAYTRPRPIADVARFASAFLEELNGVRAQADLAPLTLEPAQSATASRVAPHFFAAVSGSGDERVADEVALGLLAGWEVEGDIRTAGFAFGAVPETDDLSVLLGTTLEEPMSRGALLDPEVERLAIGSIVGDAGGVPMLAALVTTYALFDPATKHDDAEALFARLAEERHGLELPAPMRLVRLWGDAMHSADQVGHGQPPRYALDDLLQASSSALRREVRGWYGETSALEEFEFPPELVSSSRLETAIGVSHAKDPDAAWGRYIVLIVSAH